MAREKIGLIWQHVTPIPNRSRVMRFISFSAEKQSFVWKFASLHFSPDNQIIVTVDRIADWTTHFSWWNLQKQSEIIFPAKSLNHAGGAKEDAKEDNGFAPDPVISPDHRFLAYVYVDRGPDYSLRLVDRKATKGAKKGANQQEYRLTAIEREKYPDFVEYQALRFSPDGRFLVAAIVIDESRSGIYRWNIEKVLRGDGPKSERHWLAEPDFFLMPIPDMNQFDINRYMGMGRSLIFSSNGTLLAAGLWGNQVLLWEFPSGHQLPPIKLRKRREANACRLSFHPKTGILAVADQSIAFYDPHKAKRQLLLSADTPPPAPTDRCWGPNAYDIEFHPSGHWLASACGDSLVRFWDGETGVEKETFDWKMGNVRAVAFSPDGCLCAAGGETGIAIWDVSP